MVFTLRMKREFNSHRSNQCDESYYQHRRIKIRLLLIDGDKAFNKIQNSFMTKILKLDIKEIIYANNKGHIG